MSKIHALKIIPSFVFLLLPTYLLAQFQVEVASAKVEYSFNILYSHGSKSVIIADSGRFVRSMDTLYADSLPGALALLAPRNVPKVVHVLNIQKSDSSYSIDMDAMIGSSHPFLFSPASVKAIAAQKMKKIGSEIYLGKECGVYDYMDFKFWFWKGILLKKEITIDGITTGEYAVTLDEYYKVTEEDRMIPAFKRMN